MQSVGSAIQRYRLDLAHKAQSTVWKYAKAFDRPYALENHFYVAPLFRRLGSTASVLIGDIREEVYGARKD